MLPVTGIHRFLSGTGKPYIGKTYAIEGDYSSASYFFAIAAICGGRVTGEKSQSRIRFREIAHFPTHSVPWDAE